jgi:hypothetical protein
MSLISRDTYVLQDSNNNKQMYTLIFSKLYFFESPIRQKQNVIYKNDDSKYAKIHVIINIYSSLNQ